MPRTAHVATASPTVHGTPTVPSARRPRRSRTAPTTAPLGSLVQRGHGEPEPCPECAGTRLTTLTMTLTDGTVVRFTSCRRCEHRRWEAGDGELSIGAVLDRTRRTP